MYQNFGGDGLNIDFSQVWRNCGRNPCHVGIAFNIVIVFKATM